jgi:hypothetical protein
LGVVGLFPIEGLVQNLGVFENVDTGMAPKYSIHGWFFRGKMMINSDKP